MLLHSTVRIILTNFTTYVKILCNLRHFYNDLRNAKKNYERELALSQKSGVWAVLKRKGQGSRAEISIDINGTTTSDKASIAASFKNMFENKVNNLKTKSSPEILAQAVPQADIEWDFEPCTPDDVANVINKLKSSMCAGPDKIPSRLLKELKYVVTCPLATLVNRCISESYFPACFKLGKVIPIHKSGSRKDQRNYRPITITSVIGKIIEGVLNEQLNGHIEHLLPPTMFGFRKNMGTADALTQLTDDIKERRAKGEYVATLVCDASSAFDLLCRETTIIMLKRLGAGDATTKLISSFMADTNQYVVVDDVCSEEWSHDVGSGQGHILSPPLYNIGTLSQYYWTQLSKLFGYADDGCDVISALTISECNVKIQQVMAARQLWYSYSGMALNIQKTTLMGFGFTPDPIHINNVNITPVTSMKFLGITVQSNLGLDQHVKALSTKIRMAAANIRSEGRHFGTRDRRTLYMGWVQGALCSNATAFLPLLSKTQTEMLQLSCNAAIRSVAKLPRKSAHTSISTVRKSLNILSVSDIAEKTTLMQAWKLRKELTISNRSGPQTRAASKGHIPHPIQKGLLGNLVKTHAALAFNKLPMEVKQEDSLAKAKYHIRKMFKI